MTYQLPEPALPNCVIGKDSTMRQIRLDCYTADQMQTAFESGYEEGYVAGNQAATESRFTKFMDSYTRAWVGLTDEEWEPLYDKFAKHQEYGAFVSGWGDFTKAIEAKLKEKNT